MSQQSSPVVRRAAVTYGRRKAPALDENEDLLADTSIASIRSAFGASSESGIDLPPDSDDLDVSFPSFGGDDDDEDEELADGSFSLTKGDRDGEDRGYEFDWKRKLREMDGEEDDDMGVPAAVTHKDNDLGKGDTLKDQEMESESAGATDSRQTLEIDDNPFSSSLPVLTSSSGRVSPSRPSTPPANVRSRVKKRVVAQDSSDSEPQAPPPKSPASGHRTTTPPSRSSTTPPTSQEMILSDKKKGKQKAVDVSEPEGPRLSSGDEVAGERRKGKGNKKRKSIHKRPTKKEIQETKKATARIIANQDAHIPRANVPQLSISNMLDLLRAGYSRKYPEPEPLLLPSSDPIQQFSSPNPLPRLSVVPSTNRTRRPSGSAKAESQPAKFQSNGLLGDVRSLPSPSSVDSDDDMPDMGSLLAQNREKRAAATRAQELAELKKRALKQQASHHQAEDDDSDLEIIGSSKPTLLGREGKQKHVYVRASLKNVLKPSVASMRSRRHDFDETESSRMLAEAAAPQFSGSSRKGKGKVMEMDQRSLNQILAQRMASQGQQSIRQKESEWTKRGGRLTEMPVDGDRKLKMQERILALSEQALQQSLDGPASLQGEEQSDSSDEEWRPDNAPDAEVDGVGNEENENDAPGMQGEESGFVVHQSSGHTSDAEDTEDMDVIPPSRHPRQRHIAVLDSDEEGENAPPKASFGRVLVPDTSFVQGSSTSSPQMARPETADGATENETDKENDVSMAYDRGEDKENTAVGATAVLGNRASRRSTSFALGLQLARETDDEENPFGISGSQGKREPFREISRDEDDPFMSEPINIETITSGSPHRSVNLSSPSLSPLRLQRGLDEGFDFSEDAPMSDSRDGNGVIALKPAAAISPGFSRLFDSSATKVADSPAVHNVMKAGGLGFSQFFTPDKGGKGLSALRKANDISLTFNDAQPSLDVSGTLLQKADDIFDKEQEFVVEGALRKQANKQQLFVNEHGFLTQTRPSPSVADCYSVPSSVRTNKFAASSPFTSVTRTGPRRPLDTLVLEDEEFESPTVPRTRRLVKRNVTPEPIAYESSPSPSPKKPRNAFGVLMQPRVKPMKRLEKSEFVEGEAEESDEDRKFGFGFGGPSKDDDDSDGEDQDQTLTELVDDQQMDADTLNEEKVLEKVKEHQQIDDEELERLHRDAAEGKLRAKRRDRGIGFEDSDSEDDDEENARRRQKIANKKRRIDGDTLDEIAKDPETRPFVEAYNTGINDDDNDDFAHLMRDDDTFLTSLGRASQDFESDDEDDENNPGVVSAEELRQRARKVARGEESISVIDPTNVSYIDQDDEDEENYRVKEVVATAKRQAPPQAQDSWEDGVQPSRSQTSAYHRNMESWARHERTSRTGGAGTGRAGASAVTGLTKSKMGGGSITGQRGGSASSNRAKDQKKPAKLSKAPSVLSAVSSRRGRFV